MKRNGTLKRVLAALLTLILLCANGSVSLAKATPTDAPQENVTETTEQMSEQTGTEQQTTEGKTAEEKTILRSDYADLLDVDVLKMGHHGSRTSSSAAFLKAVTPDYCVISCGAGNDYGHPHKETLQKLSKIETQVLRTDQMGSIRFYSDGVALSVETDQ